MIRHLVISGGGPNFLAHLGILEECIVRNVFDVNNLVSCHATSAGTMVGILIAMRIPIAEIINYFLERPWDKWMKIDTTIFDMKCFFDSEMLRDAAVPFFSAYDVPLDVTFSQFYDRFGVDLHMYASKLTNLESVDLSRATHPHMSITEAAIMSCSVPPMYKPHLFEGNYFIDGGFSNNFPVLSCLQTADPNEVLAISNDYTHLCPNFDDISVVKLMAHIADKMTYRSNHSAQNNEAAKQCKLFFSYAADTMMSTELWQNFLNSPESRRTIFDSGKILAITQFNEVEHC
jgi:predicted acylesterase/phospholipase RssA